MPQDFYTLDEAARRLGVSEQQLLDMAKPGAGGQPPEVRSFMDRGAPRFRKNEIEEVARRRGLGSDTDVPLGLEQGGGGQAPRTGQAPTEVFRFELSPEDREREEDTDIFAGLGGSQNPPAADSEVRLIPEGSDLALQPAPGDSVRQGPSDSGVKIERPPSAESSVQLGKELERGQSDSDINLGAPLGGPKSGKLPPDSGVRLVEDWLVAKEQVAQSGLSGLGLGKTGPKSGPQGPKSTPPGPKSTPPSGPKSAPKVTPFSLAPDSSKSTPKPPAAGKSPEEGSSEFELTPLADFEPSDSVFDPSSVEHAAVPGKDTGKIPPRAEKPVTDSDDESISFEISPEPESSSDTMRRKKAKEAEKAKPAAAKKEDSSEFDLTPLKEAEDSSSEFELTLEDEEGLAPAAAEKTKAGGVKKSSDIDLAPLEEEDTNVEGSDFELALEEEPAEGEGDTGSEVVVIDEESGEAAGAEVELEEEGEELVVEAAGEEEEATVAAVTAPPAEWGWVGLLNLPTTLILLFTGFMLLEMMRSIWSYNSPSNPVSGAVFQMIHSLFNK